MPVYHPPRAVLRVAGDDAGPFLDSLLTRDVSRASAEAPVYAALLTPQGKVSADVFAHRAPDGALLLDVAAGGAGALLQRLTLYRLRRRVLIDDVSDAWTIEVRTDGQSGLPPDPRMTDGRLGARYPTGTPSPDPAPLADYEAMRIAGGVADVSVDAGPEEVFALEALLEELNGVDFQKGCFVGQENVSRMKRRATTRRKFCPIVHEGPPLPPGTPVTAGPVVLGDVRASISGRSLALLRLDRALAAPDGLTAGERPVRLAPPDWLILPAAGDA